MLKLHRGNRADLLVGRLAHELAVDPIADPMVTEVVAVQSRGMERWLSHHLAQRLGTRAGGDGISTNLDFPFPGRLIQDVLAACGVGQDGEDPWAPERLVWPILELLPELEDEAAGAVHGYLRSRDHVDRRGYGLARRVADLFDRYALFRPQMVEAWSRGAATGPAGDALPPDQRWQAELWMALEQRLGAPHTAMRFAAAVETLRDPSVRIERLPTRVALFGTSALPPAYLEVLAALATRIDVSLYVIVPSPDLWDRVRVAAGSGRVAARHPLLVSSARLARDFQVVLERIADYAGDELFEDPTSRARLRGTADGGVLARLQSDLLHDQDRGDPTSEAAAPPAALAEDDRTVQFHACHGPNRQVEVLHDRLLHLFEDDPSLEPRDVLVMTPDIEAYAPLVASVFGRDDADARHIPFRIADRTLRRTNPVAAALMDILNLADSRFTASGVLDLLGSAPVRRSAGLEESDIERIHPWVAGSGVRWGIDAAHRDDHGQPAERHHTWRAGLDRLLLGVAMPDEDDRTFAGVVPYDDMEGDAVGLLSTFVDLCERLFEITEGLCAPRPIEDWEVALTDVVQRMTSVEEDERWLRDQVVDVLGDMVRASRGPTGATSTQVVTLDAVRSMLDGAATGWNPVAGYETGAVTFCAMIPMRSIPHRVVCLLGMDDGAFPRTVRPLGFDLIAMHPEVGDRDQRDEDRLLFLEALLAAREHLLVLYTGRDPRTNEPRAPAVPVAELRDVIDRSHVRSADDVPASHRVTTEHPLQAFSPRNFGAAPLSFEVGQLAAAKVLREDREQEWRFFPAPLRPPDDPDPDLVELGELRRFLLNPTQWIYTRRLGMWLREERRDVDDNEPVETDALGRWAIGDDLLETVVRGGDRQSWEEALTGRGTVPAGTLGHHAVQDVEPTVQRIARWVDAATLEARSEELTGVGELLVDVAVEDTRLHGAVTGLRDGALVEASFSTLKAKHRLGMWVRHLALSVAHPDLPVRCVVVGREGRRAQARTFRSVDADEARGHLAALLRLFHRGRCEPLPLFDRCSEAYAAVVASGGSDPSVVQRRAAAAARDAWEPNRLGWGGDLTDVHVSHCYGEDCDFDSLLERTDFREVAETVWLPVLAAEVAL